MSKSALFIDTSLNDYQTLADAAVAAGTEVYLIEADQSGLVEMATWAETHSGYDNIGIMGHGAEGMQKLGNTLLTSTNLDTYASQLTQIGQSLTSQGDLLLYGCNVGAGETGQGFIESIARITQADVAASDNLTGAAAKGGDWVLEEMIGNIETSAITADYFPNTLTTESFDTFDNSSFSSGNTGLQSGGLNIQGSGGSTLFIPDFAEAGWHTTPSGFSGQVLMSDMREVGGTQPQLFISLVSGSNLALNSLYIAVTHQNNGIADLDLGIAEDFNSTNTANNYRITGYNSSGQTVAEVTNIDLAKTSGSYTYGTGNSQITFAANSEVAASVTTTPWTTIASEMLYTGGLESVSQSYYNGKLTFGSDWSNVKQIRIINWSSTDNNAIIFVDSINYSVAVSNTPPIVTPIDINLTDTAAFDTFAQQTGNVTATDSDGLRATPYPYGIVGGQAIDGGGISYSITKDFVDGVAVLDLSEYDGHYKLRSSSDLNYRKDDFDTSVTLTAADTLGAVGEAAFTIHVTGANDKPIITEAAPTLSGGTEAQQKTITLANIITATGATDADTYNTSTGADSGDTTFDIKDVIVKTVSGGTLLIGTSAETATAFNATTNNIIDATHHAYWTPSGTNSGTLPMFTATVRDKSDVESDATATLSLSVASINHAPTIFGVPSSTQAVVPNVDATLDNFTVADVDGDNLTVTMVLTNGTLSNLSPDADDTTPGYQLVGAASSINSAIAGAKFTATANGDASIAITVSDGNLSSSTETYNLTASSDNSIPQLGEVVAITTGHEDTEQVISLATLLTKADEVDSDGTVTAFVVQAVTTGTLKIGADAASATPFAANTNDTIDATHHAFWTPAANISGTGIGDRPTAFTVVAKDNVGAVSVDAIPVKVDVAPMQDAPVLTGPGSFELPDMQEGSTGPQNGDTANSIEVSSLIVSGTNYSDAEDDNQPGIAITGVNASGTLWYSTNGGSEWIEVTETLSDSNALTLTTSLNNLLYFQPDAGYIGTLTDALTFRAWDGSEGANGRTDLSFDPVLSSGRVTLGSGGAVASDGRYAFVGDNDYTTTHTGVFKVFDAADPKAPLPLAEVALPEGAYINGIALSGHYAFVAAAYGGLMVFDISDPVNPVEVTGAANGNNIGNNLDPRTDGYQAITIVGNYAYVSNYGTGSGSSTGGLFIYNISTPLAPTLAGELETSGGLTSSTFVLGNYAYLASAEADKLQVVNISDKAHPVIVGAADALSPRSVVVVGDYAYVGMATTSSLRVINISDPANPQVVGSDDLSLGGIPFSLTFDGEHLYAGVDGAGVKKIDISTPAAPSVIATFATTSLAVNAVTEVDGVVFIVEGASSGASFEMLAGSSALSANSDTVAITVTEIPNDPPAVTVSGPITASEDAERELSGIEITDADGNIVTVTVSVDKGGLQLATLGDPSGNGYDGITVKDFNGTDGSISFSGLPDAVNDLLTSGLKFFPPQNFSGAVTLTVSANDGRETTTETQTINVEAENDAPNFNKATGETSLSPSWSSDGYTWSEGRALQIQPDGKIALVGQAGVPDDENVAFVSRMNADGSMDHEFAGGDSYFNPYVDEYNAQISATTLQADGKILTVMTASGQFGTDQSAAEYSSLYVHRFTASGEDDYDFGENGGYTSLYRPGDYNVANGIAVQSDGKIIVSGWAGEYPESADFVLFRLNADGTPDESFDSDNGESYKLFDFDGGADTANCMKILADNSILVAGMSDGNFALAKFTAAGDLDTSFDTDGKVTTDLAPGETDEALSMTVDSQGRIILAGYAVNGDGNKEIALVRYTSAGALDGTFGTGGKLLLPLSDWLQAQTPIEQFGTQVDGNNVAYGVTVDAQDRVVITGSYELATDQVPAMSVFLLARLTTSGALDTSFGTHGVYLADAVETLDLSNGFAQRGLDVEVLRDGQILTSGTKSGYDDYGDPVNSAQLLRFSADGIVDSSFGGGADTVQNVWGVETEEGATDPVPLSTEWNRPAIFDVEMSAADNYEGAILTIAREDGANGDDEFSFDTDALTALGISVDGTGLKDGATTLATFSASEGSMMIWFNAGSTQARVDKVTQCVTYLNTNANPPLEVGLAWTINDGDSESASSMLVTINGIDDTPKDETSEDDPIPQDEDYLSTVTVAGTGGADETLSATAVLHDVENVTGSNTTGEVTDYSYQWQVKIGDNWTNISSSVYLDDWVNIDTDAHDPYAQEFVIPQELAHLPTRVRVDYSDAQGFDYSVYSAQVDGVASSGAASQIQHLNDEVVEGVVGLQVNIDLVDDAHNAVTISGADGANFDSGYLSIYYRTGAETGHFIADSEADLLRFGETTGDASVTTSRPDSGDVVWVRASTTEAWVQIGTVDVQGGTTATTPLDNGAPRPWTYFNGQNGAPFKVNLIAAATPETTALLLKNLQYVAFETGVRNFDATLNDGHGGTPSVSNFTLTIGAAPPENSFSGTWTTPQETTLSLAGQVQVVDEDVGETLTVTLSVDHGDLGLPADGTLYNNLTMTDEDGSDGDVSFSGSVNYVNALLNAALTYTPDVNYSGTDRLTITTSDGGTPVEDGQNILVTAVDGTPPVFQSATTNGDGTKLYLYYNEALNGSNGPSTSAFTVIVDGETVAVSSIEILSSRLALVLETPITRSQVVTVAYADPTTGNDTNATQDAAGNDAATLTAQAVDTSSAPTSSGGGSGGDTTPPSITITSNGGNATAAINVAENSTAVTTVTATDGDAGQTPTFAITGGADQAKFSIVGATGVLTFATAPNFESPTDLGDTASNNTYVVEVTANDGNGGTDVQALTITVSDVDETPPPPPPVAPPPVVPDDGDAIPPTVENQTPGLPPANGGTAITGDGNGDGVVDSAQSNVTSVTFRETDTISTEPGAPTTFISLVADSDEGAIDTTDTNSAQLTKLEQKDAPADLPPGVDMPLGLISFTATVGLAPLATDGTRVGITETFSLFVDDNLGINGYWKQNAEGTWVNLASEVNGGQSTDVGTKLRLDFQIQDGGEFDADHKVDGIITDPGAAAYLPPSLLDNAPHLPHDGFWF